MNVIGILFILIPLVFSSNLTNTSFFTPLDDLFIFDDPSDKSFQFIKTYCTRGEFLMIDSNGNEDCYVCDLDLFKERYDEINLNVSLPYRHGKCIMNPHHWICKMLVWEFMKCSQWTTVCPKKDDIEKLEPTPFTPPPVTQIVNKTCTYYRFTQYMMSVDMALRCNCDKNNVIQDVDNRWMVGAECTGYPTTLD